MVSSEDNAKSTGYIIDLLANVYLPIWICLFGKKRKIEKAGPPPIPHLHDIYSVYSKFPLAAGLDLLARYATG